MTECYRVEPLLIGSVTPTAAGNLVLATVTSIRTNSHHILVDTGGFNQWLALQDRLAQLPPVTAVVLTHFHWDHCANVRHFSRIPIYASLVPTPVDRATLLDPWHLPLEAVHEGDVIAPGVTIWEVPGHTDNHLAVAVDTPDGRWTIAGDAWAHREDGSQGRPPLIFGSAAQAAASLERIRRESNWVIPGHDAPFVISAEATR